MRKGPVPKALRFYFRLAFTVLWVVVCFLPAVASQTFRNLVESALTASFGLAILVVQLYFTRLGFGREYRRSVALRLPARVEIDETGLHCVTSESDIRSSWRLYRKYSENKSTFVLFKQGSQAFVPIPKHSLTVPQIQELRSVLAAHLRQK